MSQGYDRKNTSVHLLNCHFVWCPKYRRSILIDKIAERIEQLIQSKCKDLKCSIIKLQIMSDHIHLFAQLNPTISPNQFVGRIKGFTSKIIRDEFPKLRSQLPSLWTRSYFVSSAGNVSQFVIQKYIEAQKGK